MLAPTGWAPKELCLLRIDLQPNRPHSTRNAPKYFPWEIINMWHWARTVNFSARSATYKMNKTGYYSLKGCNTVAEVTLKVSSRSSAMPLVHKGALWAQRNALFCRSALKLIFCNLLLSLCSVCCGAAPLTVHQLQLQSTGVNGFLDYLQWLYLFVYLMINFDYRHLLSLFYHVHNSKGGSQA